MSAVTRLSHFAHRKHSTCHRAFLATPTDQQLVLRGVELGIASYLVTHPKDTTTPPLA